MTTKSPHLDREWLYQRYVVDQLSTYDIAKMVNRDPKRIYEKLVDFGIPTRPRGHNLSGNDNYMAQPGAVNPFQGRTHTEETRQKLSERAKGAKPHIRGERNGMYGRTGKANPNYKDGSSPDRQRLYASSAWRATMRAIYQRDNYRCVRCGTGKTTPRSLHAHHIKPWAGNESLRFDPANIVTLCRSCHHWVHSKENTGNEYR